MTENVPHNLKDPQSTSHQPNPNTQPKATDYQTSDELAHHKTQCSNSLNDRPRDDREPFNDSMDRVVGSDESGKGGPPQKKVKCQ